MMDAFSEWNAERAKLQTTIRNLEAELGDARDWINNKVASCAKKQCSSRDRRLKDAESLYFEAMGENEQLKEEKERRTIMWRDLHDLLARGWHITIYGVNPPGNPDWKGKGEQEEA